MKLSDKENEKVQAEIRRRWEANDIFGVLREGFHNFMRMLTDRPRPIQNFLDDTGKFFDAFISDCSKNESIRFIGGTMEIMLEEQKMIHLQAKFYFQNDKKEWILKTREGAMSTECFSDWGTAPELICLHDKGRIEFPIDPPEKAK